jgi:hypothetical protein
MVVTQHQSTSCNNLSKSKNHYKNRPTCVNDKQDERTTPQRTTPPNMSIQITKLNKIAA